METGVPKLRALGGLKLEAAPFTRPTPLLLLAYLSLEGPQQRRHLAELFWPEGNRMKSLSMTLTRLRQGVGEVIEADDKQAKSKLKSDAQTLLEALDKSDWQRANELYTGAFLEGVILEDWSSELEEWVYTTREYLAERVQYAVLNLAEEAAQKQDFDNVFRLAERAYTLPGLSGTDLTHLKRLYPLLCAGRSLLAPEVRKELEEFGLTLSLTTETARASFAPTPIPKTTLPLRATSFVGRDEELTKLATLLSKPQVSLLTLLGPAGVGKTRLALQLAHEQLRLGAFKDGIYFIPLDALTDAGFIATSLVSHLGISQQGQTEALSQLTHFIAEKHIFIVLDNFEHLTEGAGLLADLLHQCPNLKLLVTSRERLKLKEEHLYTLEGLAYPTSLTSDANLSEAVQLFRERAQQVQPHFELGTNLTEAIKICKLVEGLPLGIELAASWVRLMSCQEIASEIEKGLELLTTDTKNVPERHRSLKAAFEQSWKLLTDKEQEVLRKLSVFVGGFRREAASEVAGATIPVLASLVDKSLLKVLPNGRYDRHPLLYQFTQEKLANYSDEQSQTYQEYTTFYLELSRQAEARLYSRDAKTWLIRFDEELANVRTILARADSETALDLTVNLTGFWASRGLHREVRDYLTNFLDIVAAKTSSLYIKGLYTLADVAWFQGAFGEAKLHLERALALARKIDDKHVLSRVLGLLARIYQYNYSDYGQARILYEECITLADSVGNQKNKASALNLMAILVSGEGDFEAAQGFYEESLTLWRELGDTSGIAYVLNNLANIYDSRGQNDQAEQLFQQSLSLFRDLGDKEGTAMTLFNLGHIGIKKSNYDEASRFAHESLVLARELGYKRLTADTLICLCRVALYHSNYEQALALSEEAHALNISMEYKLGIGDSLRVLGDVHQFKGEWGKAIHYYQEGLALCRSINDIWGTANITQLLAVLELEKENFEAARVLLEESLRLARDMKSQQQSLLALEGLALLNTRLGALEKAVSLWGFCDVLRQELGSVRDLIEQKRYETAFRVLRRHLGKKFETLLVEGKTMNLEQVLDLTLDSLDSNVQQNLTVPLEATKP